MMKLLLLTCVLCAGCIPDYSEGTRAGQVIKFSKKGIYNKTWEGTMALGGFRNAGDSGGVVANTWEFTVCDERFVAQVQAAQQSGSRVRLHYVQEFIVAPWRRDSEYCVDAVERED